VAAPDEYAQHIAIQIVHAIGDKSNCAVDGIERIHECLKFWFWTSTSMPSSLFSADAYACAGTERTFGAQGRSAENLRRITRVRQQLLSLLDISAYVF
jgi:hypothetical protein